MIKYYASLFISNDIIYNFFFHTAIILLKDGYLYSRVWFGVAKTGTDHLSRGENFTTNFDWKLNENYWNITSFEVELYKNNYKFRFYSPAHLNFGRVVKPVLRPIPIKMIVANLHRSPQCNQCAMNRLIDWKLCNFVMRMDDLFTRKK
jgi:hypothetical protein